MSIMVDENRELDFPEFYAKSHKSKKTNKLSHPKCCELYDEMVNLQVAATEAGTPLTREELLWQVLGQKKHYLRGFGIGPRPFSPHDSAARARDKHMEAMRAEIEVLREEQMKEKKERHRDCEEMTREKEEMMKQVDEGKNKGGDDETREEMMKQVEERKKEREAQQEQLNHLNDVVLRLTILLQGLDSHCSIW
ncbi:hypothetical protein ACSBR1_027613 [Camellia fascicularis]